MFAYHTWDEAARPKIAQALKVKTEEVKSDLMGEWRRLRNWVVHPSERNKKRMLKGAKNLVRALGLQQDDPILTTDMAFRLMEYLDRMQVDVNPKSLEFGLQPTATTPKMVAMIIGDMEPGTAASMLIMAPEAHLATDIIADESSGTIHMNDCHQRGEENEERQASAKSPYFRIRSRGG